MDKGEFEMRTDKELIELLLKKVKKDFNFLGIASSRAEGLCLSIMSLKLTNNITEDEKLVLNTLIEEAAKRYGCYRTVYWWEPGRKRPRVKFLKQILKELQ